MNRTRTDYHGFMQPPPEGFRLTPISYSVLLLLAVLWPLSSFVFFDAQAALLEDVAEPVSEVYLPTMAVQLGTLLLVLLAVRSESVKLADVGLHRFSRWTVVQAAIFVVAANLVLSVCQLTLFTQSPTSFNEITGMIPRTGSARLTWAILCMIVAFAEEMVFRGYLLTRISRFAGGRVWVGVLVSTIAFAAGHLYQGVGGVTIIALYGFMFAGLYLYTDSLYPGIVAHFMQDITVLFLPSSLS